MALPKTGYAFAARPIALPKNIKKRRKKALPKTAGARARASHIRRSTQRTQLALPKTGTAAAHGCPSCGGRSERYTTAAAQFPHSSSCKLRRRKARVARWVVEVAHDHHDTVGTHARYSVTYQSELVRCGKANCKGCRSGGGHGPYWYAYWTEGGKTRTLYIGKKRRPAREVLAEQQQKREAA